MAFESRKSGNFKSLDIKSFAKTILPELSPNIRTFIVMNNASIYKTSEFIEAFSRVNYILKFFTFYFTQLNPI